MTRDEMRAALERAYETPDESQPGNRRGLVRRALAAVDDPAVPDDRLRAIVARALGRKAD